MRFHKYQALGNDYIVILDDGRAAALASAQISRICDRHFGVGSDGILLVKPAGDGTFNLRILNPDGSEAETSGNGLRIAARYLIDLGYTSAPTFTVHTLGGAASIEIARGDRGSVTIAVGMGVASFDSERIPMTGPSREVVGETLEIAGEPVTVTCVSLGNPHCVLFADGVDDERLRRLGPAIERHASFPNGTNVQLASVVSATGIDAIIWERGAGETLASGSSASAVAAAARRNGLAGPSVVVRMPGGSLEVDILDGWQVRITGTAEFVYEGEIE